MNLRLLGESFHTRYEFHAAGAQILELCLNGALVGSLCAVSPQNVNPGKLRGDLYSEAHILIAHRAWFQRHLTAPEIAAYDGTLDAVDRTAVGKTPS